MSTMRELTVVCKRVWELHRIFVQISVLLIAFPAAVRRLVLTHQKEWLFRISALDPVNALIRDDVGRVAGDASLAVGLDELGVPVLALARDDAPVVEAGGLMGLALAEVPLADHGGLVAAGPQVLGHVGQVPAQLGVERHDAVDVVVRAAEDGRP